MASSLESPNGVTFLKLNKQKKRRLEDGRAGKSLEMPLGWNSIKSASSLRFLLKKAFDFRWLFAFLSIMTKVVWDAAYPGNMWGFLNPFTVAAS